jgi:hypothetical protein
VNFTREPIIETVITPREGCKLIVRNSKGVGQEDYFVDAIEVVSFGHSFFFRSLERPKSFLVPVSDYEVLELKETRVVLKNASAERSIKIGGGRESPVRAQLSESSEEMPAHVESSESMPSQQTDHKQRDRRRSRRRRGGGGSMEARYDMPAQEAGETSSLPPSTAEKSAEEVAPTFISKLFPPPPTLIKETLSRYKTTEEGVIIEKPALPPEEHIEPPAAEPKVNPDEETKFED